MKFITEAKLNCGHEITFGNCAAPGNLGQITHQKDAQVVLAYNDFLEYNEISPKRILEIGVARGGSLAIWREMFGPCEIIGVDNFLGQIQPWTLDHFKENPMIQIYHMNMPSLDIAQFGMFDLIVDDGPHGINCVLPTFEYCWPMLNQGGIYIVEDWIAYDQSQMLNYLVEKIVGYWPDPMPYKDAPFSITTYRGLFAIRKKG